MVGTIPIYDLYGSRPDISPMIANLGNAFFQSYDAAKKRRDEGDQRAAQDEQAKILLASLQPAQAVPSDGGATLGSAVAPQGQQGRNLPTFARVDNPPSATLGSLFAKYGEATGVSPNYLARTAKIESGYDPNAKNPSSSAGGLFQFIDGTAKQYGVTNKFDPEQATAGAARLAADNKRHLAQTLGRAPTDGELYLAHQQGAGGAARLLANPNARAADIVGTDAVRLNGGNPNETAGDFAARWVGKFNGSPPAAASASPAPSATIAQPARPAIDPSVQLMLQSANPYVRAQGIQLAQQALKPGSLSYQSRPDGSIVALDPTGKRAPQIVMQGTNNPLDERKKQLEISNMERDQSKYRTLTTPAERAQYGVPSDYKGVVQVTNKGEVILPGKASTEVNIDQKAEGEESKQRVVGLAKFMNEQADGMAGQVQRMQDINSLDRLLSTIDTGSGVDKVAQLDALGKQIGLSSGVLASKAQAVEAIVNRIAPTLRIAGSGTTSDRDLATFMKSLPQLTNTPDGNRTIVETLRSATALAAEKSNIARKWQTGEISGKEASARIAEIDNRGFLQKQEGQAVRVNSVDEARRLPSGTRFMAPDGRIRVTP